MYINGTLLIQVIHFLLALWIMRKFLFKPILAVLLAEDAEKRLLHCSIEQCEQAIAEKNREYEELKDAMHSIFAREMLIIHEMHQQPIVHDLIVPFMSSEVLHNLTLEVTDVVVDAVGKVNS
jgi:hypothetical protein